MKSQTRHVFTCSELDLNLPHELSLGETVAVVGAVYLIGRCPVYRTQQADQVLEQVGWGTQVR